MKTKNDTRSLERIVNQIHHTDVLDGMRMIPDASVTLVFTSPPYNLSIDYGSHEDNLKWAEYLDWLEKVWIECARVLRKGGRLAINIDSIVNHEADRETEYYRCVYADLVNQMRKIDGMHFRTEICWYKQNTVGRKTAWGSYRSPSNPVTRRNHEYILIWSKDQWQLPKVAHDSDLTGEEFQEWILSTWFIQPETKKMGGHPVPFPGKLVKAMIKMNSYPEDVVLDPFSGSGTTAYIAKHLERRYIGFDNHLEYVEYARRRISDVSKEDLFAVS